MKVTRVPSVPPDYYYDDYFNRDIADGMRVGTTPSSCGSAGSGGSSGGRKDCAVVVVVTKVVIELWGKLDLGVEFANSLQVLIPMSEIGE